jgi:predicted amidophosphoribosyltransferase
MLTVRITVPKNLDKTLHAHVYTFTCPGCGKFIAQLDYETTPLTCKHCGKPLSDVRSIIEREAARIAWHGMDSSSWEKYE